MVWGTNMRRSPFWPLVKDALESEIKGKFVDNQAWEAHIDQSQRERLRLAREGEMDVEMQEPLGTNTFVNIFSPQYHGPGAKHLPVEDTVA